MNNVDRGFQLLSKILRLIQPSRRRRKSRTHGVAEILEDRQLLAASGLQVVHRSGQSFVTWQEDTGVTGEGYHVYRSASPITSSNIGQAQKLTSKWGALDDNTSHHPLTGVGAPTNFVIQDLGSALSDNTGLFVYTIPAGGAGNWYYAVTEVIGGSENQSLTSGSNSLASPVADTVATPQPVLISTINNGNGRVYTQFMDYANWNPTFEGYAYNYSVALPVNYDPNVAWPLRLMPHAYGERYRLESNSDFGWPVIEVFPDDGGAQTGFLNTWWYGFSADHNYKTNGPIPTSGSIENFTEQRLFQMMDQVQANFNIDSEAIHIQGHSMGASGALALGMRYGDFFSWIFSSEPMTNYATNPIFQGQFQSLWGTQASNLPVINKGPHASRLAKYNGTGVYDWMNLQQMVGVMRAEPMAMLMVGHGKIDDVIDWQTQGLPIVAALNNAHVAFTAENRGNWDHNWMSFDFMNSAMFGDSNGSKADWIFRKDSSLIAFSNASGSGPLTSPPTGTDFYNLELDWSVPWNNFGAAIVDQSQHFEVTLRSRAGVQTADVTPQRTTAFKVAPGATVTWQNRNVASNQNIQSGSVTADAKGLVTIPGLQILTNSGNRLILDMTFGAPVVQAPSGTTSSQTPTIIWSASSGATSYEVWIKNLSTGQNPMIQTFVGGTSFTANSSMGIGLYRVWVRAITSEGSPSAWSAPEDFQITTTVAVNNPPSSFSDSAVISWAALPGAAKYDLWVNNVSTGQQQVVRNAAVTATSYQLPGNLPLGKYTVWVRGIDAGNNAAYWSPGKTFNIASRTILSGPSTPGFDTQPTFQWQTLSGATKYEVFVRNLITNAITLNPVDLTATNFTPSSAMPVSEYRWWVRGSNNSGVVGTWSLPLDFNVGGKPTVLAPTGTTSDRTPTFSWTPVQGAARYELWVSKSDGSGVVINLTNITTASYTPASNMVPYEYRVWVRAVSSSNVFSTWSTYVDFTVTSNESPFEILTPEDLSTILVSSLTQFEQAETRSTTLADARDYVADADFPPEFEIERRVSEGNQH
jgi:pimeloyl-ACP methyl ester carboxylesterase